MKVFVDRTDFGGKLSIWLFSPQPAENAFDVVDPVRTLHRIPEGSPLGEPTFQIPLMEAFEFVESLMSELSRAGIRAPEPAALQQRLAAVQDHLADMRLLLGLGVESMSRSLEVKVDTE